jgi:hypothetical protein
MLSSATHPEQSAAKFSHVSDQEPQPGVPLEPEQKAVADRILAGLVADRGAPSLDHYRRVYAT